MAFLKNLLKVLFVIAMLLVMAAPFLWEYSEFNGDKKKKISYKRFRMVVYTLIYIILITIALFLLKEFFLWVETLSFVQWLVQKLAPTDRTIYCAKVFVAVLVNFLVGIVHLLVGKLVRIGLKKRDLVNPKRNGKFSWSQKLERKVIKFFYTETWFFVASILKWISITLSAVYVLVFAAYLSPAVAQADWISYDFVGMLFSAGYIYPTITLLGLWQAYFFLAGIQRLEKECPELIRQENAEETVEEVDLHAIDAEIRKQFGDFYACDVELSNVIQEELASNKHHPASLHIAQAVEGDKRNPQARKETYLECLDRLVEGKKGVLINGSLFTEFSMYFLRYLSVILARGDNLIFVCNSDAQIEATYDYLKQGLSEITSLYCHGFQQDMAVDFDDPIWRICKVSGEHSVVEEAAVDECNILITSLSYLCSTRFENEHSKFITLVDAVVFVGALDTVNMFNRQMAVLNTRLKHITKKHALAAKNSNAADMFRVKYVSRQVRYICFDDSRTPGLDKVLKNMLSVDFESVDAMRYSPNAIVRCYNYEGRAGENGRVTCPQFLSAEEEVSAVMNMAVLCLAKGATSVTVFAEDMLPYENYAETLAANMGQISIQADGSKIRLNKQFYNPDQYSVIIAMDSGDNLPETLRRYLSYVSDKPSLVIIFSRPYMLRDYYRANISEIWGGSQLERIPVEEGTKRDVAQKILIRANADGITKGEILKIVSDARFLGSLADIPDLDTYIENQDIDSILKIVLEIYGETVTSRLQLYNYFEYVSSRTFDENGKYNSETKIVLR
ncbi:MAG: hypothetical protein J6Q54_08835, partial [Oscillospiraceae bacterium]|nr:hypothetical protein [Oscillospiraceae bacterium]